MADPQGEEHPVEGALPAGVQTVEQVLGGPGPQALEAGQGLQVQGVEIPHILHQAELHQLLHHGRPHSLYVHGIARGKVLQPALELGRAGWVLAAAHGLVRVAHHRSLAHRAGPGKHKGAGVGRPLFQDDFEDLGDDIPTLFQHDGVPRPDVLAADLVLVVQGGALDGGAGQGHRVEQAHRGDGAGPAHLQADLAEDRAGPAGPELIGHLAARTFGRGPQAFLLVQPVDLGDDAVDFVGQPVPLRLVALVEGEHLIQGSTGRKVGVDRQTPLLEGLQMVDVGGGRILGAVQPVREKAQMTPGYQAGILQLERAGRSIAGIGEQGLVLLLPLLVECFEIFPGHVDLAADFSVDARLPQAQGDRPDGPGIGRDFVALHSVAAGGGADQQAVLVGQAQGHSVDFQLGYIG